MKLPSHGTSVAEVLARMDDHAQRDCDWRAGKVFSLIYNAGDEVHDVMLRAYERFLQTNALSPMAFPSLKRFEGEVLSMCADLLHGPEAAGTMTSGGTESICMAVKTARDFARDHRREADPPEMVLPVTAHPAFRKAAHYFGVRVITVPVGEDMRADMDAYRDAISERTILLVGSAPSFPHGVVDPIEEIAALAGERGLLMHADACLGGFMLPFVERLGYPVPPFDFRVPGVTSISADLHKFGFAAKGASLVLYRTKALRRYQFFTYADWPGGVYGSPSLAGARGGGPIAAAWAVLSFLGEEGFLRLAKKSMEATRRIIEGIQSVEGLRVLGKPVMSVFAFTADGYDVYRVADSLDRHGWLLDRQQRPVSLHMTVSPAHESIVERFLSDLREGAQDARQELTPAGGASAMYGIMARIPDRSMVDKFVLDFLDSLDVK